jgi:hypothetical protein
MIHGIAQWHILNGNLDLLNLTQFFHNKMIYVLYYKMVYFRLIDNDI